MMVVEITLFCGVIHNVQRSHDARHGAPGEREFDTGRGGRAGVWAGRVNAEGWRHN